MKARSTMRNRRQESGIALLIAIFVLLLISVVAISLVVSSGTESALAGNYRSSTGVYYAALAGMEEARGRLLAKNPNSFLKTGPPNFLPPPLTQWDIGYVRYILNPGPADGDILATYQDKEYDNEFGPNKLAAADVLTTPSVWNVAPLNALPVPGPLYKWVRINAVSEVSLKRQVAPFGDGHTPDPAKPIYYDGTLLTVKPTGAQQVLEITSLAVLPNGSQKIVQYLAAPTTPITLPPFPAALTLAGNSISVSATVGYSAPASNGGFSIKGNDQDCTGSPTVLPAVPAVGVLNSTDASVVIGGGTVNGVPYTGIPSSYQGGYTGTATTPSVKTVNSSFSTAMESPAGLDAAVQSIIQNADATVPTTSGSAERTFLSNLLSSGAMSSTSPLTVVVNGDLDLTGWNHTGYGLLLVTGTLNYDPDASWDGIVMVVGQGQVTGNKGGSGEFDGAMFVARTRDPSGVLLSGPNLGYSYVNFNNGGSMGGTGIRYSNCWIQKAQPTAGYRILSFHEISQ